MVQNSKVWRRPLLRLSLLASTCLGVMTLATGANAQILLNENLPDANLGFGADYLRRGSGYGSAPDTISGQDTAVGVTVLTRPHPEYDPQGFQYGKIRVDLSGAESLGFDTNPLGLSNAKSSPFNETQGGVTATGVWDHYGVTSSLTVQDFRYWNLSQLNHTDYSAYLGGYYDIGRDRIQASFTHLKLSILPTGLDAVGVTNQVTPFTDDTLRLSYTTQFGRFTVIPDASYSIIRFGTSTSSAIIGGPVVDNTINNRNDASIGMTVKYELSPGRDIVGIVRGTNGHFTNSFPGVVNNDYMDYQFLAGLDVQTQGKFRYRALVGYETRRFNHSGISSQSTPVFEGQVIWVPTQLTTVTATASREIINSIGGGATSFKYTTGRIQVDHEVRRNIVLTAFGQLQNGQFQQNVSANVTDIGVSATYKMNRHLSFVLSNEFLHRSSSSATLNNYSDNITLLTVKVAL